ncbi:hypothetical protein AYL99_09876 [Fonsecaea erecta]|uniref:Uncharacterized protein n=1 Tax=Fonsecaea erecta TaxID=1367422 RepID=A0A178Z7G9_9EURO|nr:hypothetical protein AYL99_09876 [Fonsecaea erecta]OAP55724.1 hypothetical protein AYL99_09876 [Fonsecaea erecta]
MDSLPVEVRSLVYAECVKARTLNLLLANRKIYHEHIPYLRGKFVLGFHIDPAASASVITLIDADNAPWGNNCTIDAVSAHPDFDLLDKMPVDFFAGIRIVIDAPEPHDPGQLVRGWFQANRLATALLPRWDEPVLMPRHEGDIFVATGRTSRQLPWITIHLRDRGLRKWIEKGEWHCSVPSYTCWDPVTRTLDTRRAGSGSILDAQTLLLPFARIRYAESAAVQLPRDAPYVQPLYNLTVFIANYSRWRTSFGLYVRNDGVWDDTDTLSIESGLHVWLDYLLDDMDGPTAAVLRRDRFKHWCSTYEVDMGKYFHGISWRQGVVGRASDKLHEDLVELIARTFHDRFMAAREHVVVAYRDALRRLGQTVVTSTHKEAIFKLYAHELALLGVTHPTRVGRNGVLVVGTDQTFWETCYPHGIVPKSRNDAWDDTLLTLPLWHRLYPPLHDAMTACQTFPAFVGRCPCDNDVYDIYVVYQVRQTMRDFLFQFNSRPNAARVLGPIP